MTVFDDIKSGLEQASQYENGQLKARKVTLSVAPVAKFTPADKGNTATRRVYSGRICKIPWCIQQNGRGVGVRQKPP